MTLTSIIEIYDLASQTAKEVFRHQGRIEAPNFSPDGSWLLVNAQGLLWKVPLDQPKLIPIETGPADRCNNDHGFTKDGRILFGSHFEGRGAQIYAIPLQGGRPEKISNQAPSWWHGLSPNGDMITYPAVRAGNDKVQIYKRALLGAEEIALTTNQAHNDGPDYSADGTKIYWNSDQSGHAQIWVMNEDGSDQKQLFSDERVNWFPHPSPCGNYLIYLSYPEETEGHPADLIVDLMLCRPDGSAREMISRFTGGQGSLNVPPWHPKGGKFAYIRYEL